jgi:hypothetical protein
VLETAISHPPATTLPFSCLFGATTRGNARLCLGSEGSEGAPTASDSGRYVNQPAPRRRRLSVLSSGGHDRDVGRDKTVLDRRLQGRGRPTRDTSPVRARACGAVTRRRRSAGGGGEEHAELVGPEAAAARAIEVQAVVEFLDPILDVTSATVDGLVEEARVWRRLVITKRGLSRGSRPVSRTTSALMRTRCG